LVGVGAVDVVESDGVLCYHFERADSGGENLGVDRIAQGGDQAIDPDFTLSTIRLFGGASGSG
jgi:hypothetical protein